MGLTTVIQTIDDLDVSPGSGYAASFIFSFHQPGTSTTVVERDEGPVVTAVAPGLHRLPALEITIEDEDDPAAYQIALFRSLDTTNGSKALVISDADGGNRRYVMFVTEALQQKPDTAGMGYVATLIVHEDVRWRADEDVVETLNWTSSGAPNEIVVDGHLPVYPTYTITPRAAKSVPGWPHMLYSVVRWQSPLQSDRLHPIDLTGGGWNTAALVTAGDLVNNTNIGVLNDSGTFIPFWYGAGNGAYTGFNNASTKIWVNHPTASRVTLTLRDFLAADDMTASARILSPAGGMSFTAGWLLIDDELISFNGYYNGTLLNVIRGVGETTPADHDAGTTLEKVFVYRIVYGPNSSVPARLKDAAYLAAAKREPLIDKALSSNATWKQQIFKSGIRTAGWVYTGTQVDAFTQPTAEPQGTAGSFIEPWTAMGFRHDIARPSRFSGQYAIPIKSLRLIGNRFGFGYEIDFPGAPQVSVQSDDFRELVTLWEAAADAEVDDFDETVTTPTVDDIAEGLDVDTARLYDRVRYEVTGTNHIQTDIQTVYVNFIDEHVPLISLVDVSNSYDMEMVLANLTTGEELYIDIADVAIDESIVINVRDSTVTYTGDGSNRYAGVRQDEPRAFFLRLVPGANTLVLFESGIADVDVDVRYTPRYYA